MNWSKFDNLKIKLNKSKKDSLIKYKNILQEENKNYNLTTIIEDEDIINKHFYDSLIFTNEFDLDNQKILDIGTGAGFPGIVLKIIYPNCEMHLVESNTKKINFLTKVIDLLDLKNIFIHNTRAEEYTQENSEYFDIVISRATAPLNILLEIGVQGLKIGGFFICLKSKNYKNEMLELNDQEKKLGLSLDKIQNLNDTYLGERNNLFYKKIKSTPQNFPRKYSQIKKRPLGK